MRSFILLGAAALVSASPAPQGFSPDVFNAIPNVDDQGPPVGVGPAEETAYIQGEAQATAAAAASGVATAAQAKRSVDADLEKRWFWLKPQTTTKPTAAPTTTAPAVTVPALTVPPLVPTSTNTAPSSCTPVGWTNTWAFTADPACPTAIEVGTYCGFINPLDPCAAQPNAYGPLTVPDTLDNFKNNPVYSQLATSAKTPSGYEQAFSNLQGSVEGSGYLAYKVLTAYEPAACSAYCDENPTCTGFNIFIERDPKWNQEQCSCNAPSIAQIKCSIWGQEVKKETATNVGSRPAGFDVIIVASNGYNKKTYTPPPIPNTSNNKDCNKNLHNQPQYCMGQKTFPGPFDPSLCAAFAQKQNELNKKSGLFNWVLSLFGINKGGCVQFQAAYLEKAGKGFATHCRLFTKKFTPEQATLPVSGGGWGCQKSFTWDVDINGIFNWGAKW